MPRIYLLHRCLGACSSDAVRWHHACAAERSSFPEKGKPTARRGRKATGQTTSDSRAPRRLMVSRTRSRFTLSAVIGIVAFAALSWHTGAHASPPNAALAAASGAGTLLLTPQDTSLTLDATNYSTSTVLNTYTWPDFQPANEIVMKFNLSTVPAGAVVNSAILHLRLVQSDTSADATYAITVHKVVSKNPDISQATGSTFDGVNAWTANACCSNGVPMAQADISQPYDTRAIDKAAGDKAWTITSMAREWLLNPATNFGLLLNADLSKPGDRFRYFA